jgi:hypothetical protein
MNAFWGLLGLVAFDRTLRYLAAIHDHYTEQWKRATRPGRATKNRRVVSR